MSSDTHGITLFQQGRIRHDFTEAPVTRCGTGRHFVSVFVNPTHLPLHIETFGKMTDLVRQGLKLLERILRIASNDAKRLSDPRGFSGPYSVMHRSSAIGRIRLAEAYEMAAEDCGVPFDHTLSITGPRLGL